MTGSKQIDVIEKAIYFLQDTESLCANLPVQIVGVAVCRVNVRIGEVGRADVLKEDQQTFVAHQDGAELLVRAQHRRNVPEQHRLGDAAALHRRALGLAGRLGAGPGAAFAGHWAGAAALGEPVHRGGDQVLLFLSAGQVAVQLREGGRVPLGNLQQKTVVDLVVHARNGFQ